MEITFDWLVKKLNEVSPLSGQAFAFIAAIERVTGKQVVYSDGYWYIMKKRKLHKLISWDTKNAK